MTEKQFKVTNISTNGMIGLFKLGNDTLSVYDVTRLVNELSEENEQLKLDNKRLLSDYTDVCNDNIAVENEIEQLKQSNQKAIEFILDGIVEMHDGKRDYAETLFNKAIRLLKGDV